MAKFWLGNYQYKNAVSDSRASSLVAYFVLFFVCFCIAVISHSAKKVQSSRIYTTSKLAKQTLYIRSYVSGWIVILLDGGCKCLTSSQLLVANSFSANCALEQHLQATTLALLARAPFPTWNLVSLILNGLFGWLALAWLRLVVLASFQLQSRLRSIVINQFARHLGEMREKSTGKLPTMEARVGGSPFLGYICKHHFERLPKGKRERRKGSKSSMG